MPKVRNDDTENCLRTILLNEGYQLNPMRSYGETGVDIIAEKDDKKLHIEVIGYKSSGPARAKDFYEVFFRSISRLKDGAKRCVIAMPSLAEKGLPARAKQYGIAWQRIGDTFPELEIWLVDIKNQSYTQTKWNDWVLGGFKMPVEMIATRIKEAQSQKKKVAMFHYQILMHADELRGVNAIQFCRDVGMQDSFATEFKKMLKLAEMIKDEGYVIKER
jgi:hypothetical protein